MALTQVPIELSSTPGIVDNSNATAITIDSSENVGIGTSPSYKLDVFGSSAVSMVRTNDTTSPTLGLFVNSGSNGVGTISVDNGGHMTFDTGSTGAGQAERMRIDSSGNVGIGVTDPSNYYAEHLVVAATDEGGITIVSDPAHQAYLMFADGTSGNASYRGYVGYDHDSDTMNIVSNGVARFYSGNPTTERMRIDSVGNLLVGSSASPQVSAGTAARTQVIAASSGATAFAPSLPASATGTSIRSQSVTAAGTGWNHFVGSSGNGSTLTTNNIFIYGNGDIGNTNNTYGAISDAKLKENITDATPKLADINAVRVVNYNLIDHPEVKQLGVIAQELEQIFPNMVSETPDRDMEGNDLGTVTKSVKYSVFVPMLIKAMQEQQATIESQAAAITDLTTRLTALENN